MSFKDIFKTVTGQESLDAEITPTGAVAYVHTEGSHAVYERDEAITEGAIARLTSVIDELDGNISVLTDKVDDLRTDLAGMEGMLSGACEFNPGLFKYHYNHASKIGSSFGLTLERSGNESFDDKDNLDASIISGTESLKDVAKKGAAKLKELFIQLYNAFLNVYDQYLSSFARMASRAKELEKEVTDKSNSLKRSGKIELPRECNFIDDKGMYPQIDNLYGMLNGIKSSAANGEGTEESIMGAVNFVSNGISKLGKKHLLSSDENTNTYNFEAQGFDFTYVEPTKGTGVGKMNLKNIVAHPTGRSISPAAPSDLSRVLREVIMTCNNMKKADMSRKNMTTIRDRAIAKIETGEEENGKIMKDLHHGLLQFGRGVNVMCGNVTKAQLAFVTLHLKHKGDKKED